MLNVFVGYDPRQPVAAAVAAHSIWTRSSEPVAITRLQLLQLPITRRGLTEFTYSRFLVPWLSGFQGWSLFVDADVLCLDNVADLFALVTTQPAAAVHVVQGAKRFEWASVMLFDNERCKVLTPEYVGSPSQPLFDLSFAGRNIGALPPDWNHLVGYDRPNPRAKIVHFTQGIPIWPETNGCEHADAWHAECRRMTNSVSFAELMGRSVHAEHMAGAKA